MRPPATARSPRPQSTDRILIDRLSQSGEIGEKTLVRSKRPNAPSSASGGNFLGGLNGARSKMRSKSTCSASSMRAVTPLLIDNLERPPPPSRTSSSTMGALIVGDKATRFVLVVFIGKTFFQKKVSKGLPSRTRTRQVNWRTRTSKRVWQARNRSNLSTTMNLRSDSKPWRSWWHEHYRWGQAVKWIWNINVLFLFYFQINESVKNELDELKYEFQLMQGSLSELKNDKKQTIDAINSKLNRNGDVFATALTDRHQSMSPTQSNALSNNITCFRCNGKILEYIQLQCGHVFCLHCHVVWHFTRLLNFNSFGW